MVEFITNVNSAVNGFVWGVPMLVLLVGTGILMTILTKFFQLSHLGHWFKNTVGGIFHDEHVTKHTEAGDQSISQFQSLCTALAATIGTGNIVGVASALVAGGPGAIFRCFLRHDDQLFRKCTWHLLSPQELQRRVEWWCHVLLKGRSRLL